MSEAQFAALEVRMAQACHARLANCTVTPANGAPFDAQLRNADAELMEAVTLGDYTLRYLTADAALRNGDLVDVTGSLTLDGAYRIAEVPRRLNAQESTCGLVRA